MSNSIGNKIKNLRIQKKITQSELASVLGIAASTVGMYEQDRREPDLRTLIRLCEYFEISADELLGISKSATILPLPNCAETLSPQERLLVRYYRERADVQLIVKDLLNPSPAVLLPVLKASPEESQPLQITPVFEAAHSEYNHPPKTTLFSKEKWDKIATAPETNDPLL